MSGYLRLFEETGEKPILVNFDQTEIENSLYSIHALENLHAVIALYDSLFNAFIQAELTFFEGSLRQLHWTSSREPKDLIPLFANVDIAAMNFFNHCRAHRDKAKELFRKLDDGNYQSTFDDLWKMEKSGAERHNFHFRIGELIRNASQHHIQPLHEIRSELFNLKRIENRNFQSKEMSFCISASKLCMLKMQNKDDKVTIREIKKQEFEQLDLAYVIREYASSISEIHCKAVMGAFEHVQPKIGKLLDACHRIEYISCRRSALVEIIRSDKRQKLFETGMIWRFANEVTDTQKATILRNPLPSFWGKESNSVYSLWSDLPYSLHFDS